MNDATVQMPTLRQRFEAWVTRGQRRSAAQEDAAASTSCPPARAMPSLCCYSYCFCGRSITATAWVCLHLFAGGGEQNSMWQAHDNLLGLIVHPAQVAPVFAGQPALFGVRLEN